MAIHTLSFLTEPSLLALTDSLDNITCMIRDCMCEFRHLKSPTCSYKETCSLICEQTVFPSIRQYANRSRHFTLFHPLIVVQSKQKVEQKPVPMSPLQYSGFIVDDNEQIKAYSSRWLDQDNGRQQLITSYVRSCINETFLTAKKLPYTFSHVVIGGNCGIYSAYTVDWFGNVTLQHGDDYNCYHPEADTVLVFAVKRYLELNLHSNDCSIVVHCPEADNSTILLLEHQLLRQILTSGSINLFCTINNKLVDATSGKPTKKPKETASMKDIQKLSCKVTMEFYIDFTTVYESIILSDNFKNTRFAIESLGALSIFTGNDKNPGIRHVSKHLALTVYSQACKDNVVFSLVDEQSHLSHSSYCHDTFLLLYGRI